jgi:hypothetical protein
MINYSKEFTPLMHKLSTIKYIYTSCDIYFVNKIDIISFKVYNSVKSTFLR